MAQYGKIVYNILWWYHDKTMETDENTVSR